MQTSMSFNIIFGSSVLCNILCTCKPMRTNKLIIVVAAWKNSNK